MSIFRRHRPLRILHCPWNVGGQPGNLARAERELGLQSHAVQLLPAKYQFGIDETLCTSDMTIRQQEIERLRLLWRAIRHFDVIHFNFGQSLLMGRVCPDKSFEPQIGTWQDRILQRYWRTLWMTDLPLLKALRKGIVMTYQGDDARQGDECRRRFAISAAGSVDSDYYTPVTDHWKRKAIARVAAYADRIYALNPDLLHVLPAHAQFLPYANIDPRDWTPSGQTKNAIPLLVHAPTNAGVKGSSFLLAAVDRLHREGVAFEFMMIENLTHAEARKVYERADLLVDQLLLGWYGGVAVEFMALAKPVICYLREEDLNFIPAAMRADLPIINSKPMAIYQVLKEMLTSRRTELSQIGQRCRTYVEKWHDPIWVAQMLAEDYATIRRRRRQEAGGTLQESRSKREAGANG